ncbi:MAG: hypothetical protein KGL39_00620 [Patescibacteria group bacterium]|nr:hypothetical protein [Patescibacteria group bacterium]
MNLLDVRPGMIVNRRFCIEGEDPVIIQMKVTAITGTEIICGAWKFDRYTGGEIDEELDWDGRTKTGSIIVPSKEKKI